MLKRSKTRRRGIRLLAAAGCAGLISLSSVPVHAYSPDVTDATDDSDGAITAEDGNLEVVDEVDEETSSEVQFLTVTDRDGNVFYIIIDNTTDEDNVYFLNQVDAADLYGLLDEDETAELASKALADTDIEEETEEEEEEEVVLFIEEETEEDEEEEIVEEENAGSNIGALLIILILAVGVVAAYYFFRLKPEKERKASEEEFADDEDYNSDEESYDDETDEMDGYDEEEEDE